MSTAEVQAGKAYVEVSARDKSSKVLDSIANKFRATGKIIAGVGAGLQAASIGLLAPLVAASKNFATIGAKLDDMSKRTGIAGTVLSELAYAGGHSDVTLEDLGTSLKGMSKLMGELAKGGDTAKETIAALGLNSEALLGMSPEQRFMAIADALSRIGDVDLRNAMAMKVFGEGGMAILPLIEEGAAGIEALRQQARDLGVVLSAEDIEKAAKLDDAWARLFDTLTGFKMQAGAGLADVMTIIVDKLTLAVSAVNKWVAANRPMMEILAAIGVAVLAAGTAIVAFGGALYAAGVSAFLLSSIIAAWPAVVAAIGVAFAALTGPIAMTVLGVGTLVAAVLYFTGAGGKMVEVLSGAFGYLLERAKSTFGGMADAIMGGDLQLAGAILWATLKLEWTKGVAMLEMTWLGFKTFTLNLFDSIGTAIGNMFIDVFQQTLALAQRLARSLDPNNLTGVADAFNGAGVGAEAMQKEFNEWAKQRRAIRNRDVLGAGLENFAEIARLEAERNRLLEDAAKKRKAMEGALAGDSTGKYTPGGPSNDTKAVSGDSARGTFNSAAIGGLSGDRNKVEEAIKEATEQVAQNTEGMLNFMRQGVGLQIA